MTTRFDIVTTTNRESPYLDLAVASVLAQTYPHWRMTIVDNGSPAPDAIDRTASVDDRIRVVHQAHQGVSGGRNAALRVADGDVITFLDDDDVWPPDRLATQAALLDSEPGICAVYGDGRYVDAAGAPFGGWTSPPASAEDLLSGRVHLPRITTLAARRSAVADAGLFDTSFRLAEDIEFILRLVCVGEMRSTGTVVVDYRRHDRNATNSAQTTQRDAVLRAVSTNLAAATAAGRPRDAALLRRHLRRERRSWASGSPRRSRAAWGAGRRADAVHDLVTSLLSAPISVVRGGAGDVARLMRRRARKPAP